MSRKYHNLTAHYNVYFNGKESLKTGKIKIEETVSDNYSDILPIFKYSDEKAASAVSGEMDRAIKKSVKCIKKHSITVKPSRKKTKKYSKNKKERKKDFLAKNEYCNWIDDSYLLMGKANFYKHDFYAAKKSFDIILKKFAKEELKPEALLWMARVHIELEEYDEAKRFLDMFANEKDISKKQNADYLLVYADYYMRQKQYTEAVEKLEIAIPFVRKKRYKARYTFILGQINLKNEKNQEAAKQFKEVIKLNPPYDMAFNAQIYRAIAFNAGSAGSEEIKAQLKKMLKDDKNYDYQDQIYYALAEIAKKEGKEDKAIEYYKLSAAKSVSNENQKAMAFLALADIYFEDTKYTLSQAYYDSTIQYLSNTYSEYDKVKRKATNLTELVKNLQEIQHQDSLQRVAKMGDNERKAFIENIITNLIKAEEEAKRQEEAMRNQQAYRYEDERNYTGIGNQTRGGKWYFYNPSSLNFGKTEFTKKWGKRKLEDNWRRKNKSIVGGGFEEAQEELYDSLGNVLTDKDFEYYMLKLPLTDSLLDISHHKIQKAYYDAGSVYEEKLEDFPAAVGTFAELNKRYPNGEYTLLSLYRLYELNMKTGNTTEAENYKRQIIRDYPNSEYAKRLSNPNYLKELLASKKQVENIYLNAYQNYKNKQYQQVLITCRDAQAQYPNNVLADKFEFLSTLCIGESQDTATFKTALKTFVEKYPESESKEFAQEIIASMEKKPELDTYETWEPDAEVPEVEIYSDSLDVPHFYVVVVDNKKIDIEALKFKVLSFNLDNYTEIDLNTSIAPTEGLPFRLITVKSWPGKHEAEEYMKRILTNEQEIFADVEDSDYQHFIISSNNFSVFFDDKNVGRYLRFYKDHYKVK